MNIDLQTATAVEMLDYWAEAVNKRRDYPGRAGVVVDEDGDLIVSHNILCDDYDVSIYEVSKSKFEKLAADVRAMDASNTYGDLPENMIAEILLGYRVYFSCH